MREKRMKKTCGELGKGPISKAKIFCPFCPESVMLFSGWLNTWVDYECPLCKFIISFRYDFSDRSQEARVDGYSLPKQEYKFTEDESCFHLISKRHLDFLDMAREKQLMPMKRNG